MNRTHLLTLAKSLALAGACTAVSNAVAQQALVTGQGVGVTSIDVRAAAEQFNPEARAQVLAKKESVSLQAQQIYVRRVLARQAQAEGLDKNPLIAAQIEQARERVLSEAKLQQAERANVPAEALVEQYARAVYEAEGKRFDAPVRTRARHILIRNTGAEARTKAESLLQELKRGASFESLAKEHSADSRSGARGGDLGFFVDGTMAKPFQDAVNALGSPGELSGIVETQFGLHIIKLEERRSSGKVPYDEVREALLGEARARLQQEGRQNRAKEVLATSTLNEAAVEAFVKEAAKP